MIGVFKFMFGKEKKDKEVNTEVVETIVGVNSEIQGNVVSQGSVRIDGRVIGDMNVSGNIIIGEKGVIDGNLFGKSMVVAGRVNGNLDFSNKVEIMKTGKVYGDIFVKSILIEEGAVFEGNCRMKEAQNSEQAK